MTSSRNAPTPCLRCNANLDAAGSWCNDEAVVIEPVPGDVTMCLYCGQMLMFDIDGCPTLKATEEALEACSQEELALGKKLHEFHTKKMKH